MRIQFLEEESSEVCCVLLFERSNQLGEQFKQISPVHNRTQQIFKNQFNRSHVYCRRNLVTLTWTLSNTEKDSFPFQDLTSESTTPHLGPRRSATCSSITEKVYVFFPGFYKRASTPQRDPAGMLACNQTIVNNSTVIYDLEGRLACNQPIVNIQLEPRRHVAC